MGREGSAEASTGLGGQVHALLQYGYPLVFLFLLIESLGVPSPSEASLITYGVLAGEGKISLLLVVLSGALGSIVGANISYLIALRGGRALILRYGIRVGLTSQRLDQAEAFFQRRGAWAVVIGRIISGVRAYISYVAGLFEMPYPRFLVATTVGALIWPLLAAGAGYLVGPHIKMWLSRFWIALAVVLVGAAAFYLYRRARIRRLQQSEETPD